MHSPFRLSGTRTPSLLSSAKLVPCAQREPYSTEIQNRLDEAATPRLRWVLDALIALKQSHSGPSSLSQTYFQHSKCIILKSMALLYPLSGRQEKRDLENGGGERQTQLLVTWQQN